MFKTPKYLQGMSGEKNNHLIFQTGKSKQGTVVSVNWNEFAYNMQMSCHKTVVNKLDAELFSPWSPKPNLTGRTKDCVESTALIVFDLDKIETTDIETVSSWCKPYANFVHTTYSHGINGKGCFRVYIPLENPISIDFYQRVHEQVLNTLPQIKEHIDSSSSDVARCFFLPSCPPETKKLAGYAMNLMGIHAPVQNNIKGVKKTAPKNEQQSMISPPPASAGSRNKDLASYAGKAYAKGLRPEEFINEAFRWGSSCNPPLDAAEIESVVHSMWQTHKRNNPAQTTYQQKVTKYLRSADELKSDPPLEWSVRGVLPSNGIGAIYGAPSSGKTFLALDLAFAVATGNSWFSNPTLVKPVAYIALEGSHGIRQRIQAWEKAKSTKAPKNLLFVTSNVSIDDEQAWQDLTHEIKQTLGGGAVVFIDTLNRASPTADENASASMGKIIDSAKSMADAFNGFVMLIHHAGKDASRGLRGHSSLLAALDTVIKVTTGNNQRIWEIEKSKDSETGICSAFELRTIELDSQDSWGITHTSCIVNQEILKPKVKPIKGKNQKPVMTALLELQSEFAAQEVPIDDLIGKVAGALELHDPKRGTERSKDAIKGLIKSGHISVANGYVKPNQ